MYIAKDPVVYLHIIFLLLITANPFEFGISAELADINWYWLWSDAAANALLFVPLGLALRVGGASIAVTLTVGIIVSAGIEISQLFSTRTTSLYDFLLNIVGIGLICCWRPYQSTGLRYALVLTPVLWSIGLIAPKLPLLWAIIMTLPLLMTGAYLITHKTNHWQAKLISMAWVLLSYAPLLITEWVASFALVALALMFALCTHMRFKISPTGWALGSCGLALLILLFITPDVQWPLNVWEGRLLILYASLIVTPVVMWLVSSSIKTLAHNQGISS